MNIEEIIAEHSKRRRRFWLSCRSLSCQNCFEKSDKYLGIGNLVFCLKCLEYGMGMLRRASFEENGG